MNEGLRQSQDNIGFRQLCNQKENRDGFIPFLFAIVDKVLISATAGVAFEPFLSRTFTAQNRLFDVS